MFGPPSCLVLVLFDVVIYFSRSQLCRMRGPRRPPPRSAIDRSPSPLKRSALFPGVVEYFFLVQRKMGWRPTSVERALKGLGVFFLLSFFLGSNGSSAHAFLQARGQAAPKTWPAHIYLLSASSLYPSLAGCFVAPSSLPSWRRRARLRPRRRSVRKTWLRRNLTPRTRS